MWEADQQPPWTACCQMMTANQPYQQTHTPVHHAHKSRGNDELAPNTVDLKSEPPLMRGLAIHNSPVSVTKPMLGLLVGFIGFNLTANKLLTVNPRVIMGPPKMCLLLEAKTIPAFIIRPRLILVTHKNDLGWYIMSNQQGQMSIQNLERIVSKPNVMPGKILYCTIDCIPIDLRGSLLRN